MKRTLPSAIAVLVVLISLMASVSTCRVRADVPSINFVDSDLTVYAPLNMTHNNRNLILEVNVPIKSSLSESEGKSVSMNYSVDGVYNGSVTLQDTDTTNSGVYRGVQWLDMGVGSVDFPPLPDGSHCLTIYLNGINLQNYQPVLKLYVETVYFSVNDPNSVFIPTPSTTPIPKIHESIASPPQTLTASASFEGPLGNFNIASPTNTTYNSNILILNVTGQVIVGSNVRLIMNYSLDGQESIPIPINIYPAHPSDPFIGAVNASVTLPQLSDGSHNLTVFGDLEANGPHIAQAIVCFTVATQDSQSQKSSLNPAPSLSSSTTSDTTASATLVITKSAQPFVSPSPTIPEFPSSLIAALLMSAIILSTMFYRGKPKNRNSMIE